LQASRDGYNRLLLSSLERCELSFAGTGRCAIVKRGIFGLVRGGGTRWCVGLGQARGTMASRLLLAVYAAMSRVEADVFLRSLGAEVRTTAGGYTRYTFSDSSEVWLRPNGEVVWLPQRAYDSQGQRINKGMRLDENGVLTALHTTGERVED